MGNAAAKPGREGWGRQAAPVWILFVGTVSQGDGDAEGSSSPGEADSEYHHHYGFGCHGYPFRRLFPLPGKAVIYFIPRFYQPSLYAPVKKSTAAFMTAARCRPHVLNTGCEQEIGRRLFQPCSPVFQGRSNRMTARLFFQFKTMRPLAPGASYERTASLSAGLIACMTKAAASITRRMPHPRVMIAWVSYPP